MLSQRTGNVHFRVLILFVLVLMMTVSALTSAEESKKTTLRYFTWAGGATADYIKQDWIQPFEALNPDIKIEYEAVGFAEFWDKLPVYIATGMAPDVVHMSVGYVYDYAKQGLLTNLQPYFDRDMNPKDFFMEPLKAMRYPSMETGDLYAMPFAFTLTSLYYNKGMFDSAGLSYPNEAWNWDTLRDGAKRLVRDTNGDGAKDIFGFVSDASYTLFDPLVHAFGGSILNKDLTKVTLDSPQGVKAAEYLTDLIFKDGSAALKGTIAQFTKKQAAMAVMTTLEIDYERQQGFDFDITLVPKGPDKRVVRLWPNSFSIPATSNKKDAAWRFIKYVVSRTEMDRYSGERQVPINRKLAMSKDWLRPNLMGNKMAFVNSIPYGDPLEFRPEWGKWDGVLRKELAPAWTGAMAPSVAIKKAADAVQVIIDEANKVK